MIGYGGPDGADVLDEVHTFLRRFVAFPTSHAAVAATLWVVHTYVVMSFDSTPRIAFLSPEPGSGKSRALEVIGSLSPHPMHAVNATPAALFRAVSDLANRPTILFDEIDTIFGPKAKDNEEIRGFLNAGHRKGAVAYRCVGLGTQQVVTPFPAFCAVAIAGLNDVPDTIATRSVIVRMRRRAPGETVEPFRFRLHEPEGQDIAERIAAWATDAVLDPDPPLPDGVTDRPADVWEPLLSIADAAGGRWPQLARAACVAIIEDGRKAPPSLGTLLLTDLRRVFDEHGMPDSMPTELILDALQKLDESPWANLKGKPLDARGLAARLRRYDVHPKVVRSVSGTPRGYRREDLHDPWVRYVSPGGEEAQHPQHEQRRRSDGMTDPEPSATDPQQAQRIRNNGRGSDLHEHAPTADVADVADLRPPEEPELFTSPEEYANHYRLEGNR